MTTVAALARRQFIQKTSAALAASALPAINFAQSAAPAARTFNPQPGHWRTFELTTRVVIAKPQGTTKVWLPVPSVNTDWQQPLESSFSSNGKAQLTSDGQHGARMVYAEFAEGVAQPYVELTSRFKTQNRSMALVRQNLGAVDAAELRAALD